MAFKQYQDWLRQCQRDWQFKTEQGGVQNLSPEPAGAASLDSVLCIVPILLDDPRQAKQDTEPSHWRC